MAPIYAAEVPNAQKSVESALIDSGFLRKASMQSQGHAKPA